MSDILFPDLLFLALGLGLFAALMAYARFAAEA